jgi:hypothetical protein
VHGGIQGLLLTFRQFFPPLTKFVGVFNVPHKIKIIPSMEFSSKGIMAGIALGNVSSKRTEVGEFAPSTVNLQFLSTIG